MANKTDDNRRLVALLSEQQWRQIGAQEWRILREAFPKMAETTLRKRLAEEGIHTEQPFRGVDQHSLDGLEETLTELAAFYLREPKVARTLVIAAKDKARFAARNSKVAAMKRALKVEMVDWMLVWLGDPAMFATWARLRKTQINPVKPSQP